MFVYTFWEPRENIPFYLRLCMETWKKFLPNATIVVLDYKNLGDFIDVKEFSPKLFSEKIPFMLVSDAIRVALLARHGGVWLDVDTIILNSNAEKYFLPDEKHHTVFFGNPETRKTSICFINTPPYAMCMTLWLQFIKEKIWHFDAKNAINWNIFGNAFIDKYAKKYIDEIEILDYNLVMPEKKLTSKSIPSQLAYLDYYFFKNYHLTDVNADMLFLHNSWTPELIKQISTDEIFNFNCTLVNVLAEALGINLPIEDNRLRMRLEKIMTFAE